MDQLRQVPGAIGAEGRRQQSDGRFAEVAIYFDDLNAMGVCADALLVADSG